MIDYEFDVWCNGEWVAGCSNQNRDLAICEAQHYFNFYNADGPCEIWEVIRRKVWPE